MGEVTSLMALNSTIVTGSIPSSSACCDDIDWKSLDSLEILQGDAIAPVPPTTESAPTTSTVLLSDCSDDSLTEELMLSFSSCRSRPLEGDEGDEEADEVVVVEAEEDGAGKADLTMLTLDDLDFSKCATASDDSGSDDLEGTIKCEQAVAVELAELEQKILMLIREDDDEQDGEEDEDETSEGDTGEEDDGDDDDDDDDDDDNESESESDEGSDNNKDVKGDVKSECTPHTNKNRSSSAAACLRDAGKISNKDGTQYIKRHPMRGTETKSLVYSGRFQAFGIQWKLHRDSELITTSDRSFIGHVTIDRSELLDRATTFEQALAVLLNLLRVLETYNNLPEQNMSKAESTLFEHMKKIRAKSIVSKEYVTNLNRLWLISMDRSVNDDAKFAAAVAEDDLISRGTRTVVAHYVNARAEQIRFSSITRKVPGTALDDMRRAIHGSVRQHRANLLASCPEDRKAQLMVSSDVDILTLTKGDLEKNVVLSSTIMQLVLSTGMDKLKRELAVRKLGNTAKSCIGQILRAFDAMIKYFADHHESSMDRYPHKYESIAEKMIKTLPVGLQVWLCLLDTVITQMCPGDYPYKQKLTSELTKFFRRVASSQQPLDKQRMDILAEFTRDTMWFIVQARAYPEAFTSMDAEILLRQICRLADWMHLSKMCNYGNHIIVFTDFWRHRYNLIEEIPKKLPFSFREEATAIKTMLMRCIKYSFEKSNHFPDILKFIMVYNCFLASLDAELWDWYVRLPQKRHQQLVGQLQSASVLSLVDNEWSQTQFRCYRVIDVAEFCHQKVTHQLAYIIHYPLEIVKQLLLALTDAMKATHWNGGRAINADEKLAVMTKLVGIMNASAGQFRLLPKQKDFRSYTLTFTKHFQVAAKESTSMSDFESKVKMMAKHMKK